MPTGDAQSNGTAGFASSAYRNSVVGVNRMFLRSDKLGSKDRAPSRGSRTSRHAVEGAGVFTVKATKAMAMERRWHRRHLIIHHR